MTAGRATHTHPASLGASTDLWLKYEALVRTLNADGSLVPLVPSACGGGAFTLRHGSTSGWCANHPLAQRR